MTESIIIVGAGQGGVQAAQSLRQKNFTGQILLYNQENYYPYHRPPLSKTFILENRTSDDMMLKSKEFFTENDIDIKNNMSVTKIDRKQKIIYDDNNQSYHYDKLILATGTIPRQLEISDFSLPALRTLEDAQYIKNTCHDVKDIILIGAGFIGLELAASLRKLNKNVIILEHAARLLSRATQKILSDIISKYHMSIGVDIQYHKKVTHITKKSQYYHVTCDDGITYQTDLVINAAGVLPNDVLAQQSDIICDNGIVVDSYLRSSDSDIYAIGDVACHPNVFAGSVTRVESIQNAIDQAKIVAHNIVTHHDSELRPYRQLPWFWSDQGTCKIQMAGICTDPDETVLLGNPDDYKCTVYHFKYNQFVAIDTINQPGDHLSGRKVLESQRKLTADMVRCQDFNLKSFFKNG